MYYIKPEKGGCVSVMCKRLRDFRGKEGSRHHVRKRKNIDMLDYIPIYEVVNGKLKKTNEAGILWFREND